MRCSTVPSCSKLRQSSIAFNVSSGNNAMAVSTSSSSPAVIDCTHSAAANERRLDTIDKSTVAVTGDRLTDSNDDYPPAAESDQLLKSPPPYDRGVPSFCSGCAGSGRQPRLSTSTAPSSMTSYLSRTASRRRHFFIRSTSLIGRFYASSSSPLPTGVERHGENSFRSNSGSLPASSVVIRQSTGHSSLPPDQSSTRIRINVSGHHFEVPVWMLDRHPSTLLGDPRRRSAFYDRTRDELFLDRHRPSFEAVFSYYQLGGRLRRPHHVPDDIFLAEVEFYELEKDVVDEYKMSEGYTVEDMRLPANETMRKVWMNFEYPETSRSAYFIAVVSVIMTLISIILFCIETLPVFSKTHCVGDEAPNFLDPFFVIETVCTAWFTIEVIVRFISCPSKLLYWRDFKNIVDVTAIVPYYVTLINVVSSMSCASAKSSASLAFLRVIRLIRVFKLTKHSVGLQVLIMTFKASLEGLSLFLVALVVCLLVYSSAIYYAELGQTGSQIQSIPDGFWWAIITMTTVGYGDKVPVGNWGKLIGAACAITGVLTLAIPVPIITGHFNRFYSHKTGRGRHV